MTLEPNRGYFIPKLAGFEYLEGSEQLLKATKDLRDRQYKLNQGQRNLGFSGGHVNGNLLFTGSDLGGGGG